MRYVALVPIGLLGGGVASVVAAVATGGAEAGVVIIFPVVFGSSVLLLLGVVLLIAGFLSLPWAWGSAADSTPVERKVASGGLLLVGPVPIFWGAAGTASRRTRILAAVAGGLVLVFAIVLILVAVH